MKAHEARQIAANQRLNRVKDILVFIKGAAEKGNYETYWYNQMSDEERQMLTDLGYTVGKTEYDIRENTPFTLIKWA